jgi:uncharacterized repeat protein (TIGR01451 family)
MKKFLLLALAFVSLIGLLSLPTGAILAVAPTISEIDDDTVEQNTTAGPYPFTVTDPDTPAELITVQASSGNDVLVPNDESHIILTQSDSMNWAITLIPATNQTGSTLVTITAFDGEESSIETFTLTVTPANTPPTITEIADQTTDEDVPTLPIPFTVNDIETPANDLIVTAVSSNQTLVPNANIALDKDSVDASGADWTVTITPAKDKFGTADITITVQDADGGQAQETFRLTVNSVNDPPTITEIADQTTDEDVPTLPIPFTVNDIETPANDLIVTAVSSNQTLVPNANIALTKVSVGASGANWTATITPAEDKSGTTNITITVRDADGAEAQETFKLTVTAVNDPPTISEIDDQVSNEDEVLGPIPFTVDDVDTPVELLIVTPSSNNQALFRDENIDLDGSGKDRTVTLTPEPDAFGEATITLTVSDGELSAFTEFKVTVLPVNDPPILSIIPDQEIDEDTSTEPIPFTITDVDNEPEEITVRGESSNQELVADEDIVIEGSGSERTVTITPLPDQFGETVITLIADDGEDTGQTSFTLTVLNVNDPPAIDLDESSPGTGYSTTYATNLDPVKITSDNLVVDDIDSTNLEGATVSITNLKDGAAEQLTASVNDTDITATYNNGVLTLAGTATLATYQQVLGSVKYSNSAQPPNTTTRTIDFVVNDGELDSAPARSTVAISNPRVRIVKGPDNQTVSRGSAAVFTIQVSNIGNTALSGVTVSDPLAPNCSRVIGNLAVGAASQYTCFSGSVLNNFTNTASVQANAPLGGTVSASDTAFVKVDNPNISIVKGPSRQTIVSGGAATFNVTIFNNSETIELLNVRVEDPLTPACSRLFVDNNIDPGGELTYVCAQENVTVAFTNSITVTALTRPGNQEVVDTDVAIVDVLSMAANVTAVPSTLMEPGGPVTFSVNLTNDGSKDLNLQALTSARFGDLRNPANGQVGNNSCASGPGAPLLRAAGGVYTCTFTAVVNGAAPNYQESITAVARDPESLLNVTQSGTVMLELTERPLLDVEVTAVPPRVETPGGNVMLNVTITNSSRQRSITLNSLNDALVGTLNGRGTCALPQTLAAGAAYRCAYSSEISGNPGDSRTIIVQAAGVDEEQHPVNAAGQVTVNVIDKIIRNVALPALLHNFPLIEPNNNPAQAFEIEVNRDYRFYADDREDWYTFNLANSSSATVRVTEFLAQDSQVIIYSAGLNILDSNTRPGPIRQLTLTNLPAGDYYVRVFNNATVFSGQPYVLRVIVP